MFEITWDEFEELRQSEDMKYRQNDLDRRYHWGGYVNYAVYNGPALIGMLSLPTTPDTSLIAHRYIRKNLPVPTGVQNTIASFLAAEADTWGFLGYGILEY